MAAIGKNRIVRFVRKNMRTPAMPSANERTDHFKV